MILAKDVTITNSQERLPSISPNKEAERNSNFDERTEYSFGLSPTFGRGNDDEPVSAEKSLDSVNKD